MALRDFAAQLAAFGMVLRDAPSDAHPPIPSNAILALPIPAGQAAALAEYDGEDPSTEDTPPTGARLRRVLRLLRNDDHVKAWHVFVSGGQAFLHLQVDEDKALRWYRNLDWTTSTRTFQAPRPEHTFFGV